MSIDDDFETAWCAVCGEQTLHYRLSQGRLECTTEGCHETRDDGPMAMWDPESFDPVCPVCRGAGGVSSDPGSLRGWTTCRICVGTGMVRPHDLTHLDEGESA